MKNAYYAFIAVILIGLIACVNVIVKVNSLQAQANDVTNGNYLVESESEPEETLEVSTEVEEALVLLDEKKEEKKEEIIIEQPVVKPKKTYVYSYDESYIDPIRNVEKLEENVDALINITVDEDSAFVLVGDSRTVGLDKTSNISDNSLYSVIAETGMGYDWLTKQSLPKDKELVFLLGVNDLENINKYVSYYNKLVEDGYKITLATVGPVDERREEGYGYTIKNDDIKAFNDALMENVNCEFLDLNTYLTLTDFGTTDGLHYDERTYQVIYNWLINNLK